MNKTRNTLGRGLFCSRDSGGRHEQTPAEYIEWARRKAKELGVAFNGTPEDIMKMMRDGIPVSNDIYFDVDVSGNQLSRPALDQLFERVQTDLTVTHVFIPRRDRLARPDDPIDGLRMEQRLREMGITVVFMDRVLGPLRRGGKRDIGESMVALMEYHESEKFRRDLAEKMIYAQICLAKAGYSTGGRPPFGFRRWLVRVDGTKVRQLADGERVRQAGHHVVWLPGPDQELDLIRRILTMLRTMPATQVAKQLTLEGIPSPDADRTRTDNGKVHAVSGVWHSTTITNIARNPLMEATVTYGKRSMGDKRRQTPLGPRELDEGDNRPDGKPKVIRNPEESITKSEAAFEAIVPVRELHSLRQELDRRGGTQRGKPRSRDPNQNPLGGRVYDQNCSWPMYRVPYNGSFRYTCGYYQQSHGASCDHNHVDGQIATRFALKTVQQRLFSNGNLERLMAKLQELAAAEQVRVNSRGELDQKRAGLADVQRRIGLAEKNLALAENPDDFKAVSKSLQLLRDQKQCLSRELLSQEGSQGAVNIDNDLAAAVKLSQHLGELANVPDKLGAIGTIFRALDVQLYLRFRPALKSKRTINKLVGGVLTTGSAPSPLEKYQGPTSRRALNSGPVGVELLDGTPPSGKSNVSFSGLEDKSLGNVSRGDRI
ncbi:MAG: recombinase family protein [Planctomycetales bacterium]|nr:recombinase family protein [Planctomycetales bacterium]